MGIVFKNIVKQYRGAKSTAVNNVNLSIEEGEFIVFLGHSGCGKTTLLKMVNRLYEPTSGTIEIDGVDITQMKEENLRRGIGYVIQQNGLFPHMRIEDNIAVVPNLLGWEKAKIDKRIDELLTMVHLDPTQFRKRYPRQLSGGQQQRVGIARAMAADPSILLMDEPFGAIDAITRTSLQDELIRIQKELKKTILFVTHDVDEAFRLADRIVVMAEGKIVQADSPYRLLTNPASDFVKQLLGDRDIYRRMNLLTVADVIELMPTGSKANRAIAVRIDDPLTQSFTKLVESGETEIPVVDDSERVVGYITLNHITHQLRIAR
jgi:osmoprotectant transport system ATP-binding protein